ncbi:MAG: hypothetical protein VYE73_09355 [Acidobacteriota bacterium]|nr:hypothetical protein [Acidobacteriota bacterium]
MSRLVDGSDVEAALGREIRRLGSWLGPRRASLVVGLVLLAIYTLTVNAWVSEDAFISLRSVEQVHAGNGPRWNPHERVQAYTHPLWFWLLCLARLAIPQPLFAALALGVACTSAAMVLLYRDVARERGTLAAFLAILAFLGSKSIVDYATSGLENSLSYLLLIVVLTRARRWYLGGWRAVDWSVAVAGMFLLATNRLDTLTLTLPLGVALVASRCGRAGRLGTLVATLVGSLPLLASLAFSLVYYGMLLPNTAYATVVYGPGQLAKLASGVSYLWVSGVFDVLGAGLVACGVVAARRWEPLWRACGLGVVLNLVYIVIVGGDFMTGRFLTLAALIGLFVLVHRMGERGAARLALGLGLVAVASPFHPWNPFADRHAGASSLGVVDERAFYSEHATPETCVVALLASGECPDHPWLLDGKKFAESEESIALTRNVGFFGWRAGVDKIVVDELGLTDPLLARMPPRESTGSRSGHVLRQIPQGYLETLVEGEGHIADPDLRRYYEVLGILTRDPVFSPARLRTVVDFQLGRYDHLLEGVSRP